MNSKEKVLVHKGIDRIKRNQYEESLEFFDRVLDTNPKSTDAWNNKGVAFYKMGDAKSAIECYDKALEADPENLEALRNKGFVLRVEGEFEGALEAYDKLISCEPDVNGFRGRATALIGMSRLEEALESLIEASEIESSMQIETEIEILRKTLLDIAMKKGLI